MFCMHVHCTFIHMNVLYSCMTICPIKSLSFFALAKNKWKTFSFQHCIMHPSFGCKDKGYKCFEFSIYILYTNTKYGCINMCVYVYVSVFLYGYFTVVVLFYYYLKIIIFFFWTFLSNCMIVNFAKYEFWIVDVVAAATATDVVLVFILFIIQIDFQHEVYSFTLFTS